MRVVVVVMAAMMLAGGAGMGVGAARVDDHAALLRALSAVTAAGAAGVQVRVHDADGDWTASAGVARLGSPDPVPVGGRFRAGSVYKTFVATVMLQLVGEGRLGLDDPVARLLPQFGLDPRITVRMLLGHTSGLYNYTGESDATGRFVRGIVDSDRFRTYTPAELVRYALRRGPRFAPGARWEYSNTNYILAGLIIEKITGTPYAWQVDTRIIRPLGLWATTLPGTWPMIMGPHADGYGAAAIGDADRSTDYAVQNPSWAWAAGEIVSTTEDLDIFISALLGGRLLSPPLLAQMRAFRIEDADAEYGLGLSRIGLRPGCFGLGHVGTVPGYDTFMFATDEGRRVEMSVTDGPTDHADGALLLAEFNATATGLCGH